MKAQIVYKTDLNCGAGGHHESDIADKIDSAINAIDFSALQVGNVPNYVRDSIIGDIVDRLIVAGAFKAIGIAAYRITSTTQLPFDLAVDAYNALHAIDPAYFTELQGDGMNCDGFQRIDYRAVLNSGVDPVSPAGSLYHHYVKGDGGSTFFTLTK